MSNKTEHTGAVSDAFQIRPRIALIWAMARNRVIGRGNALPWRLPADLAHFKSLTSGHPVIMGRKTYESLGRPLPNRTNIVVSRDRSFSPPGCLMAHSLDGAFRLAALHDTSDRPVLFVIGGENLYSQALGYADRLYVTLVDADIEGDARFPDFDWNDWQVMERLQQPADAKNNFTCTFLTLERKTPRTV
jgi:dihydrofolate reductase